MSRGGPRKGAGRPKGSCDPRAADAHLHVRVTTEQRDRCREAAKAEGLPLSEWVRRTLLGAIG